MVVKYFVDSSPVLFGSGLLIFFFNDTATTEIYTLSLHDALPILSYKQKKSPMNIKALLGVALSFILSG